MSPTGRFVRHFLEMLVAMVVGMMALGPIWTLVLSAAGAPGLLDRAELHALVMATNMTIGMSAWMAYRRHTVAAIVQMGVAMYLPFVVLFPFLWTGLLSPDGLFVLGHVLMLPAMVGAMLLRRDEYTGHHRQAAGVTVD